MSDQIVYTGALVRCGRVRRAIDNGSEPPALRPLQVGQVRGRIGGDGEASLVSRGTPRVVLRTILSPFKRDTTTSDTAKQAVNVSTGGYATNSCVVQYSHLFHGKLYGVANFPYHVSPTCGRQRACAAGVAVARNGAPPGAHPLARRTPRLRHHQPCGVPGQCSCLLLSALVCSCLLLAAFVCSCLLLSAHTCPRNTPPLPPPTMWRARLVI
jgi:hypothetical protein